MDTLKQVFGGNLRQFGMLFVLIALAAFFHFKTGGLVVTPANLMALLNGNAYVLVLAIGMVMVIVIGHIDLSVGSVAAFVGIVVAKAMQPASAGGWGFPWWAGLLLGLAIGALCGAWQGFWVAYMGIPGFIVTLAGYMFFRGANQYVGNNLTVPVPETFQKIGAGYLPEWGPDTGFNNSTLLLGIIAALLVTALMLRSRANLVKANAEVPPMSVTIARIVAIVLVIAWLTYMFGTGRPGTSFPVPGLILLVLVLAYTFLTERSVTGRHIYAVGGNRLAAELSGVNTKRTYFFVMMNMSILAAFAGMMFVARSTASGPSDGVGWELDAIAAVFIGGAAVSGGVGTITGAMIGGLVMAVLNNGLQLMSVGSDMTQMIKGLVLLAAVALDIWQKQQGRPSITGLLFKGKSVDKVTPEETAVSEGSTVKSA